MAQDELVDIVDEKGNFIEVITKKEAHNLGLLHKTVISAIIDSRGRWLLIKQSKSKQDAGRYVCPVGGHVSAGETEIEALKKEAQEEIGLTGEFKYELVGRKIFNRFILDRQENHFFIVYKIFSDIEPIINHEIESYKYFTEEEIINELKENPDLFGGGFHFVVHSFFPNLL